MKKVVCDICGKDMNPISTTFGYLFFHAGTKLDVCVDCRLAFIEWREQMAKKGQKPEKPTKDYKLSKRARWIHNNNCPGQHICSHCNCKIGDDITAPEQCPVCGYSMENGGIE